jgi:hypothetical protein
MSRSSRQRIQRIAAWISPACDSRHPAVAHSTPISAFPLLPACVATEIDRLAVVRHQHGQPQHLARPFADRRTSSVCQKVIEWSRNCLRDFDIFLPSTCRKPLCIQIFAMTVGAERTAGLGDLVFVVRKDRDPCPPPWMSNTFFIGSSQVSPPPNGSSSFAIDIAEHSICQPGRPRICPSMPVSGDASQPGSLGFELSFQSTKSISSRSV